MKERVFWIDNMKAIGIILVLIGHNESSVTQYIYSFHMPLFFFISGLLFTYKEDIKAEIFIKKKFKSLIVPYLIISSLLFVIWFILKGRNEGLEVIFNNLFGIVYAQGGHQYMTWGVPMWFIPCLYLVNIGMFLLLKVKKRTVQIILFISSILGFAVGALRREMRLEGISMVRLPWCVDVALMGIIFFYLGYRLKGYIKKISSKKINIIFSSILFLGVIILSKINGRIDMYTLNYKNYFLFFITAILGIVAIVYLSKAIPKNRVFLEIGKNTIYLLAFHINVLVLVKKIILVFIKDSGVVESLVRTDIMAIFIIPSIQIFSIMLGVFIFKKISRRVKEKTA